MSGFFPFGDHPLEHAKPDAPFVRPSQPLGHPLSLGLIHPRQQQRPADEQHQQRQNRQPWIAGQQTDRTHQHRPQHRRELTQHVEEAEEFPGLLRRDQPGVQGTAQRLHPSLHQADGCRQRVEFPGMADEITPDGDQDINSRWQ